MHNQPRKIITALLMISFLIYNSFFVIDVRAENPHHEKEERLFKQTQDDSPITLITNDTRNFPQIQAYVTLNGLSLEQDGNISAQSFLVLEDEKPMQQVDVARIKPGVQFVMAVNSDEMFALRDVKGTPRYDALAKSVEAWAQTWSEQQNKGVPKMDGTPPPQAADNISDSQISDDLSLITSSGAEITHLKSYADWLNVFQGDTFTNKDSKIGGFDVLNNALNLAIDQPAQPGMGKAVLFITSPLGLNDNKESQPQEEAAASPFESIIARAKEQRVHIYVWMVASSGYFTSSTAAGLSNLANQTGGSIFMFSGEEPVPNLDEYLDPLRHIYRITYDSRIRTSGAHQLMVQLSANNKMYSSEVQSFILNIVPPQPIFISPPSEIIRTIKPPPEGGSLFGWNSVSQSSIDISPQSTKLQILVDFPDGFKRPLTRSTLYVDGQVAAQNEAPPFDAFEWDLSQYTGDGQHVLQVEVVDQLELSNVSIETPILVKMYVPKEDMSLLFSRYGRLIALFSMLLAGAVLLWAMVLAGRLHPRTMFIDTKKNIRRHKYLDPVTQPVVIKTEPITRPRLTNVSFDERLLQTQMKESNAPEVKGSAFINSVIQQFHLPWQLKGQSGANRAYLVRLFDIPAKAISVEESKPFALLGKEVIIGSNSKQSTLVLEDPSVESSHTRITRSDDGTFWVTDLGSTAGTWVNYAPISTQGAQLQAGDLLHIGSSGFRFTYLDSQSPLRRSVVSRPLVKK